MPLTESELDRLRTEYELQAAKARRLLSGIKEQLETVVASNDIALAVPIEARVKTWDSVRGKFERKGYEPNSLESIKDLAGIRLITLFQADVVKLDGIIKEMLDIVEAEDTSSRLGEAQFGYLSNHYICRLPAAWQSIPSYQGLGDVVSEIQLRTLAQHMWAAASHKLQYKREDSAPPPLRRSINRVSAILEMVDLEFARIIAETNEYIKNEDLTVQHQGLLNVVNLGKILDDVFPEENKGSHEDLDGLLSQLQMLGITDSKVFYDYMVAGADAALESDKNAVSDELSSGRKSRRLARGVFFQHTGLAREALRASLGALPGDPGFKE